MTVRLTLVCAAAPVEHDVRFGDTPLDARALREARAVAGALPTAAAWYTAPSQRCKQTVRALGWDAVAVEPELRDMDMGSWQGRTLGEIAASDGAGLAAWMSHPEATPHGGESVADVCNRTAAWLDNLPAAAGRVLAVVEQAVARAAVVHVLGAPHGSFWHIDVPPLSSLQLTGRDGRWNVRIGTVLTASP
ncbi:phosphoglycerate mutase [Streptomyces viridiviolaceus]|uniref:Histidine phosphatase family protein n=1 Tax=Streptomyces viridiviolaceus TaxID=68282 RepID=A0ABW2E9Z8_9ACTN|nr:histidine phosphatase family protein [Streptomyces viridiviolaceus]GHB67788.1 phosphoglycerate mutase [Streptomyces viridiviolaceus]